MHARLVDEYTEAVRQQTWRMEHGRGRAHAMPRERLFKSAEAPTTFDYAHGGTYRSRSVLTLTYDSYAVMEQTRVECRWCWWVYRVYRRTVNHKVLVQSNPESLVETCTHSSVEHPHTPFWHEARHFAAFRGPRTSA